jgi:replicative DNA helicase
MTSTNAHAIEAERSVIGAILLNNDALDDVGDLVSEADFASEQHRLIFRAAQALSSRGEPIDELTLIDELKRSDSLEKAGGISHIAAFAQAVPTSAHAVAYAKIVQQRSLKRRLLDAAREIQAQALDDEVDAQTLSQEAERLIFGATDKNNSRQVQHIAPLVRAAIDDLSECAKNGGRKRGLSTGFNCIDFVIGALGNSELVILAARPSMGKTALALQIAGHAVTVENTPTLVFSLEMGANQIAERLLSSGAGVDLRTVRSGSDEGRALFGSLAVEAGKIGDAPLYIDDSPTLTVPAALSRARRLHRKHGLGLIVVDYLQLMSGTNKKTNRVEEVSEISRGLKALAREINVPVLALSQLSRGLESRPDKRPLLSDLRDSGAIEQDADVVAFIYREDYYRKDDPAYTPTDVAEVLVRKNRNGMTGRAEMYFVAEWVRFEEAGR